MAPDPWGVELQPSNALSFDGMTVLVIDDNQHMRGIVGALLRAFGIGRLHFADNGATAIDCVNRTMVDLAIADWYMEPTDGIAFTRHIRLQGDSPDPYLPIILMTGFTERSRIDVARDAGVNEILAKPLSPESLYRKMTAVVRQPRSYIKARGYFGPDRRRRALPGFTGPPRRRGDAVAAAFQGG